MSDSADNEIDLSSSDGVEKRAKRLRLDAAVSRDVVKALMSTPEGRSWFYSMMESCHVFHTSFSSDPGMMAFREGERNIGLMLQADVDPALYQLMIEEQKNG